MKAWVLFSAIVIAVQSGFPATRVPHGPTVYIVARPQSEIGKRTAGELLRYLGAVLAREPRMAQKPGDVPTGAVAIVLDQSGGPAGSPEGFALTTRQEAGRSLVVVNGASERGLRRRGARVLIPTRQQR